MADEAVEQQTDDRVVPVARDQRRELAAFLTRHALAITERWDKLFRDPGGLPPPHLDISKSALEAAPSLLALVEHLEAAGADIHLPAHQHWLARWHEAGLGRANIRSHFHALRDVTTEALRATDEIGEAEKLSLLSLLEAAIRNLRLETSEVETRHLLDEALLARQQFENLFQSSADPVIIGRLDNFQVLHANPAAMTLTGLTMEQLREKTLGELQADLPRVVWEQLYPPTPQAAEPHLLPYQRPGGGQLVVEIASTAVDYDNGRAAQVIMRDVTERVRFHEELERRAEELQGQLSGQLEDMRSLRMFLENIINALPARLLVLDESLVVLHANSAYLQQRGVSREEVEGKHISEVFPHSLLEEAGLLEAMLSTLVTGDRVRWAGFRQATPDHTERILNIGLDPCPGVQGERNLLVSIEDVTERHRQLYERSILHQIVQAMLGLRELPRLLHAILTGITAGGAVGLGFNRAILMLVDEESGLLQAQMAVGPEDSEQASHLWSELSGHRTLQEFLRDYDRLPPPERRPLHTLVEKLAFPLDDTAVLPMYAAAVGETVHVLDAASDPRVPAELREVLGAEEFVVAPLVVKDKIIGVAIADNCINREHINQTDVQLLTALSNHAALAIDSAWMYGREQKRANELDEAYRKLEAATERMVRSETLAAIGEVTAIVAHEIRNPLSTIGGFARMLLRRAEDIEVVKRNGGIIVDEVTRLEKILSGLLAFSRPTRPEFTTCSLKTVVESSVTAVSERARQAGVEVSMEVPEDLPLVSIDCHQMQQVLVNLVLNAVDAIPPGEGGQVRLIGQRDETSIRLAVTDTGQGIPDTHLEQIFDTFFTTKPTGTGLGLALTKKIIEDHGAHLEVSSREGQGTTFTVVFDLPGTASAESPGS
jgi:hypothetical protein